MYTQIKFEHICIYTCIYIVGSKRVISPPPRLLYHVNQYDLSYVAWRGDGHLQRDAIKGNAQHAIYTP